MNIVHTGNQTFLIGEIKDQDESFPDLILRGDQRSRRVGTYLTKVVCQALTLVEEEGIRARQECQLYQLCLPG